ncbi:NAD-dependent deacetylase hst3 [Coemansia sp. RSA 1939]|nr:NAD-dependent deacetylase hst3 [Coemansia sp. RSA 1939]KAJ2609301.1 NAD-dependent deacetylase hst3 [Coemansia sp. RSA 1804]
MKRLCLSDILPPPDGSSSTAKSSAPVESPNAEILSDVHRAVRGAQRCIVITGAGISVSSGIPDFRSPQGLFHQLKQRYPTAMSSGRDIFDATLFHDPTMVELFYSFMGELRNLVSQATCTPTHAFIKELDECGKLLRCYTQNIDSLEKRIGLETAFTRPAAAAAAALLSDRGACSDSAKRSDHALGSGSDTNSTLPKQNEGETEEDGDSTDINPNISSSSTVCSSSSTAQRQRQRRRKQTTLDKTFTRAVQLHGDLDNVVCTICHTRYPFTDELAEEFCSGAPPPCPRCKEIEVIRDIVGKRSVASGVLRPDIVLYNEAHPQGELIGELSEYDLKRRPDLLIVIGTSLKIPGIKRMIREMSRCVHSCSARAKRAGAGKTIFINKDEPPRGWDDVFDYHIAGDADDAVRLLPIKVPASLEISAPKEYVGSRSPCESASGDSSATCLDSPAEEDASAVVKKAGRRRVAASSSTMSLSSILNKTMPRTSAGSRKGVRIQSKARSSTKKLTAMMRVVKSQVSSASDRAKSTKTRSRPPGSTTTVSGLSPQFSSGHVTQDKNQPEAPRSPLVSSSC